MNDTLIAHFDAIIATYTAAKQPWRAYAFKKVQAQLANTALEFGPDDHLLTKLAGAGEAIVKVIEDHHKGASNKVAKLEAKFNVKGKVSERHDAAMVKGIVTHLMELATINSSSMVIGSWQFAGSLRRGSPAIKDVDVVVCGDRDAIVAELRRMGYEPDVRNGQQKVGLSVRLPTGKQITLDLNFANADEWGATLLYFTGPATFNIAQRGRAKARGWLLNQHGLYDSKKRRLAGETEQSVFAALGEPYLEPNQRV